MKNSAKVIAEPGKQEIFITREFEADRELVFKAFTDPVLLAQWFLPAELHMRVDFMNYKTGGAYRFLSGSTGKELGIFGIVHEVLPPQRIIKTFEYEGLPEKGHVALQTYLLEVLPRERTKLTVHYVCESVTFRDGMINSGMEAYNSACYSRLDKMLANNAVTA